MSDSNEVCPDFSLSIFSNHGSQECFVEMFKIIMDNIAECMMLKSDEMKFYPVIKVPHLVLEGCKNVQVFHTMESKTAGMKINTVGCHDYPVC